ncbi:transcriptional regulator domain-containing protein [Novosphingobium sp.]|uniref:transcriptional regulator domain-containing protein n=1 Tax=Novosphingobium sp. TaxID=1874826 RepID=UPI003FA56F09
MKRGFLPCWKDDSAYAYLLGADRAGLMWEWLRRDAGYLDWHARASAVTGGKCPDPAAWGLHFR